MAEVTYKGFTPYPFQKEIIHAVINEPSMFYTLTCGRQIGKTLLLINLLLYYAINHPKTNCLWVSPYYSMASKVLLQMINAIEQSGIVRNANRADYIITLINGSTIWFRSAEKPETIRGLSIDYAFLDEAQDISDEAFNKAILPTLTARGKKCLIAGTPKLKNWFYQYFQRGMSEDTNYKSFTAPSSISPFVSKEFLFEQEQSLPPSIFRQEFMAEYVEGDSEVFTNLDNVCNVNEWSKPNGRTIAALDVGSKQDYSVLTIMDEVGKVLYIWRDRHIEYSQIVDRVVSLANQYKSDLYVESNGVGDPIVEMIKKKYRNTTPFQTTNQNKENIIRRLISDIADFGIELPTKELFQPLYQELQMFQYKILPSGKIQYGAMTGWHDDTVMSLAICNWHRVTNPIRKKLVISSIR